MPDLSAHTNVYNSCLRLLANAGWNLCLDVGDYGDDNARHSWEAEKDGWRICADDPIQLLGLATIHQTVNPVQKRSYWWTMDGEDLWHRLLMDGLRMSFWTLLDEDPERWAVAVRDGLARASESVTPAEALGIPSEDEQRALETLQRITES